MATSTGYIYSAWAGTDAVFRTVMLLERTAVSVANNQSTVRLRAWVESKGWGNFYYNSYRKAVIDGVTHVDGYAQVTHSGPSAWTLFIDQSRVISHNSDGSRSVAASVSFSNPVAGSHSISRTLVLDTIPRATTPRMEGGGGFTTGVAKNILLPRASSSFTHNVTWKMGSKSGTINSNAGVTASWTPPHDIATEFPNAASRNVEITVVTKSGSTNIGTKKINVSVTAHSSTIPTVSQVLWSDMNPVVQSLVPGVFVQGESLVKGAVTAAGIYGSSITERTLIVDGQSMSESHAWQPTLAGTVTASGRAKDSRARVGTASADFTVLAYSRPTISALTQVRRATNSSGTVGDGAYLRLDITAAVASLKPSTAEKNKLKLSVRTRPTGGSWTNRNSVTHTGLAYTGQMIVISGGAAYSLASSYDIEITVTDELGNSVTVVKKVGTSGAALDLNGNRVGIGKLHEQGALDVAGDVYTSGNLNITGSKAVLSPYGERGNDYRGTSAQRVALGQAGYATEGMRFWDTDENRDYVWKSGWQAVDTGWISSGVNLVAATGWTIRAYKLRRSNWRAFGFIQAERTGADIVANSTANFSDNQVLTLPPEWISDLPEAMYGIATRPGYDGYYTRIGGNAGGGIQIVGGTYPGQTISTGYYIQLEIDHYVG